MASTHLKDLESADKCGPQFHEISALDIEVEVPIDQVWKWINDGIAIRKVHELKGSNDLKIGTWASPPSEGEGLRQRYLEYILEIHQPIVGNIKTPVKEVEISVHEEAGRMYILETHTLAPKMPYSDDYTPMMRLCIYEKGENATTVNGWIWIKWYHKPMFVASKIDSAATDGLLTTAKQYGQVIQMLSQGV
ncbi:hypothetical protein SeMB42_g01882 [Synchytrium endobioticum]|uniref:VASt domain-containing protein n=1 Tax=Synchytrium endobioticum TaxID=286115 RepID=A0A507DKY9_9FUNG|nr:hypothetical protein SeLEV6574_g05987 [Synchytrium endobioticum]TPX51528.1 hypothetical protein SeMB42_g01882 [Synchytrium endobioticum]